MAFEKLPEASLQYDKGDQDRTRRIIERALGQPSNPGTDTAAFAVWVNGVSAVPTTTRLNFSSEFTAVVHPATQADIGLATIQPFVHTWSAKQIIGNIAPTDPPGVPESNIFGLSVARDIAGGGTLNSRGIASSVYATDSVLNTVWHLIGQYVQAHVTGTGTYHEIYGVVSGAEANTTSVVDEAFGINTFVGVRTGTLTWGVPLRIEAYKAGGAMTNLAGITVFADPGAPGLASVATNQYGVKVGAITGGTLNYAWYSEAGQIRIGDVIGAGNINPATNVGINSSFSIATGNTLGDGVYGIASAVKTTAALDASHPLRGMSAIVITDVAAITIAVAQGLVIQSAVKGAGSTITTLYGIKVENQTQGGTNYAISTGTGAVFFGDNVTSGNNALTPTSTNVGYNLSVSLGTGNTTGDGVYGLASAVKSTAAQDASHPLKAISAIVVTNAAAITIADARGISVATAVKGAGSTITTLYGVKVEDQTQGGTNYALMTGLGPVSIGDIIDLTGATKYISFGGTAQGYFQCDGTPQFIWSLGGTTRMQLTGSALSPVSAAGITLGTSALPWGNVFATGEVRLNDASNAHYEFYIGTVRKFGFSVIAADVLRISDSAGTVKLQLNLSGTAGKFIPPSTSLSFRNNADSADNVLITDAGIITIRNTLNLAVGGAATIGTSDNQNLNLQSNALARWVVTNTGDLSPDVTNGAKLWTKASATGAAGFALPHGAAPTSPVNGDIWTTTAGLFVRINGATVGPLT